MNKRSVEQRQCKKQASEKQLPTSSASNRRAKARKSSAGSTKPAPGTSAPSEHLAKDEISGLSAPGQGDLSGCDAENWSEGDDHQLWSTPTAQSFPRNGRSGDSLNVAGASKEQATASPASPASGASGAAAGTKGVSSVRVLAPSFLREKKRKMTCESSSSE